MTSSLVGSEMCIRDSPKIAGVPTCKQHRGISLMESMSKVLGKVVLKRICLLYTSDAADDM
eukprot:3643221-Prorocentrum_lima.AAC.1